PRALAGGARRARAEALRHRRASAQRRARASATGKKTAVTASPPAAGARARQALAAGYEELRRAALGGAAGSGRGLGLALFLRSGMAAWMETCAALVPSHDAPARGTSPPIVPLDLRLEVATLLAGMALGVHTH